MRIIHRHIAYATAWIGFVLLGAASSAHAANVTGDPSVDGWTKFGNSLQQGTYVTGSANYAFDVYAAGFTVQAGSNLEITDANNADFSWLVGDSIVAVGGKFNVISDAELGWSVTGTAVNSLLAASAGPKLQVKFGTADATWTPSTNAPGSGNGNSSSSSGGGRIQVRTSAYFQAGSPNPGQDEPWTWDGNSGQVLVLDKDDHIDWSGVSPRPTKYAARMIWVWDEDLEEVIAWELLLNVSLLERLAPDTFNGLLPAIGDMAILTVQDRDGSYTDALATIAPLEVSNETIPSPAASVVGLGGFAMLAMMRRRSSQTTAEA